MSNTKAGLHPSALHTAVHQQLVCTFFSKSLYASCTSSSLTIPILHKWLLPTSNCHPIYFPDSFATLLINWKPCITQPLSPAPGPAAVPALALGTTMLLWRPFPLLLLAEVTSEPIVALGAEVVESGCPKSASPESLIESG